MHAKSVLPMRLLAASLLALSATAAAQGIPKIPDPSTSTPAGPPTSTPFNEARVVNATSGSMYFASGTKTTQKFTGVSCVQAVPTTWCGGQGTVSAGLEISLFGCTFSVGAQWQAPEADACELCGIFLCANSTTTKTTKTGTSRYENGLGQSSGDKPFHSPSSITVPDMTSAALKQVCDDSKAARDFCCPDKEEESDESEQGGEDSLGGPLAPGDLVALPDQYGFGTGFPAATPVDALDIGAFVQLDLRTIPLLPGQTWGSLAVPPYEWHHVAHTLPNVSLAQRAQIAEQLIIALDLLNPSAPPVLGHIIVGATLDDGTTRSVDLGTVAEILTLDTLRLSQPADIDMNGVVDDADLDIVLYDFNFPASYARGDVDLDGWVTQADVDIVTAALGD